MNHQKSWKALVEHQSIISKQSLSELFAQEPKRGELYSARFIGSDCELFFDYSKNHLNAHTISHFLSLAEECELKENISSLFTGKAVNKSENRPALHTALRDIKNENGISAELHRDISDERKKMLSLATQLKQEKLLNSQGKKFKHLVCIGIGGSYLGPKLVIDALNSKQNQQSPSIHFIANIDPAALHETIEPLSLEHCLFFIASKSFTTLETLQNAQVVKKLLQEKGLQGPELSQHFIAATENIEAAQAFGCTAERILKVWDFVGGRYSLWSSIGFPIAIALGEKGFLNLLSGAQQMDQHFAETPLDKNLPFLLAATSLWYQNFFSAPSRALIPYDHKLKTLPAFLQQLEMESLGKNVDTSNQNIKINTGAIIWGSEGSNSQHAFHQLLHQGSHLVPCDFIVCKHSKYDQKQHTVLLAQCLAQSRALMIGNDDGEPYKTLPGNNPSNTLILDQLSPSNLGALLALFEHKVFTQAALLNINPFDQWGVEFGKKIAKEISGNMTPNQDFDPSTNSLIRFLRS